MPNANNFAMKGFSVIHQPFSTDSHGQKHSEKNKLQERSFNKSFSYSKSEASSDEISLFKSRLGIKKQVNA